MNCVMTASTHVHVRTYLLQRKGCCLPSSHLGDREALPVYAANGYWLKLAIPEGAEEEGVSETDPPLHAGPRHHRTHTLQREGMGREGVSMEEWEEWYGTSVVINS